MRCPLAGRRWHKSRLHPYRPKCHHVPAAAPVKCAAEGDLTMSIAELTNQNGNTYNFKTDSISVVNQAPGNSGSSTTMVWSIFGHPQEVTDAPQSVLSRYNLTAKFIRLTSPGGELWVRPASVSAIHVGAGEHGRDARRCNGLGAVDLTDAGVRVRRAHQHAMQLTG